MNRKTPVSSEAGVFVWGDVFRTIVPLAPIAVQQVGPAGREQDIPQDSTEKTQDISQNPQGNPQDETVVRVGKMILDFCVEPRTKAEIAERFGYQSTRKFTQRYLRPLLADGQLRMTIPDKPTSRHQRYVAARSDK